MRNTWIVVKREIVTTLSKRSFWVMTFLFPAFVILLSVGMQTVGNRAIEQADEAASSVEQNAAGQPVGYVDQAGVIATLPAWLPPGFYTPFPDEAAAQAAISNGESRQYFLIPADFIETGEYVLIDQDFQPMRGAGNAEIFEGVLRDNLIALEPLGSILSDPTPNVMGHAIAPAQAAEEESLLSFIVPFATMFIFFFTITSSSGFMLNSVAAEKENRTAEILLTSLRPRELMLGKVIGLGFIALLQMGIWMGGGMLALERGSQLVELAAGFSLPPGFTLWALLFFILGYFLYSSAMGAVGTLSPNAREGGQYTFLVILPLLLPLWFNVAFTESPNGLVATGLSLFPLTAPTSMLTRLAAAEVPLWQVLTSLGGLAVTTYFFVLISSRFFRADTLLSSEALNWKRLGREFGRSLARK